jgi:GST-like protein
MIEILTANTPNGKKITIMCEEIGFEYKITKINIYKDEQFNPKFRAISPFSKIPVIIDHDNNTSLFESGAILMYLGEKSGKFYPKDERHKINQWLMGQMSHVGPMLGQHHQFHHYNPGKSDWGEKRYFKIAKTIYKDLDERLEKSKFLAGPNYSIADIATFPWIARHKIHSIGLKNFKHLVRWYKEISKREAVIKGFDLLKRKEKIPEI